METAPETPRRSSLIGIISAALGILTWLALCVYVVLVFDAVSGLNVSDPSQIDPAQLLSRLGGPILLSFGSIGLALLALILGAIALVRREPRSVFAIVGLVLGLACILPICLSVVLAFAGGGNGSGG